MNGYIQGMKGRKGIMRTVFHGSDPTHGPQQE